MPHKKISKGDLRTIIKSHNKNGRPTLGTPQSSSL